MMAHWKITSVTIKRKFVENNVNAENNSVAGNADLLVITEQGQEAQCF